MITDEDLITGLRTGFATQERYVDQARVDAVWERAQAQAGHRRARLGWRREAVRWPAAVGVLAGAAVVAAVVVLTPRPGTTPNESTAAPLAPSVSAAAPSSDPSTPTGVAGALPAAETARLPACRAGDIAFVQMVGGSESDGSPPQGILEVTFRALRPCRLEAMPNLTSTDGTPIRIDAGGRDIGGGVGLARRAKPYYVFRWDLGPATRDGGHRTHPQTSATVRLAGAKGGVILVGWPPGVPLRLVEQRVMPAERTLPASNPGDVFHETLKGLTGVNPDGVSFGSDLVPTVDGKPVTLVLVIATNGRSGYVWRDEWMGPTPSSPADIPRRPEKRNVPVYDSSGKRRIGTFVVGGDPEQYVVNGRTPR